MADLLAKFRIIDEMSQKMGQIASAGDNMLRSWQTAGAEVNAGLAGVDKAAAGAAKAVEEVARSTDTLGRASSDVASSASALSDAMDEVQESASGAAQQTDYWTDAVGNYSKDALEAIYTTEELVEMGFKTQDALEAEAKAAEKAADAAEDLGDAAEDAGEKQEDMSKKGVEGTKALADALTAAGIVKLIHEIGTAFMEAALEAERFETSIAQLQTIAGADHISELSADINELSRRTGIAASSLAGVAYNAISAGSAVEEAVGTAEAASKLATAGFTDTTSALSVLSTAMNSYGDAAGSAMDISNSLIMVQNLGVTTVAELSQQIGRAIATASGYSVSLGNLEAAYISTTKAGINTAQSTTYINAMLVELGKASSDVSKILVEETGRSFGQLMQSGESLADVLGVLYNSANGDTEAFMNLWGSATAGMGAAAIINQGLDQFNQNLIAVENSAGATEQAYSVMANTTEFAHQRMKNSMEQVSIAFGSQLNPALEKVYNAAAKILGGTADFIDKHPKAVKAITAVAVGIGVAVTAIMTATTVINVLIPAIKGLGLAINSAMGPIGWIAIGISAVTAAAVAFTAMSEKAEEETLSMTAATRAQYYALQDLQVEYEHACDIYGETSEEASRLKYQVDDLSASFSSSRKTVDEFVAEVDAIIKKHDELFESFDKSESAIKDEELANLALIAKLADMAASTDHTAASQAAMNAIIEELNGNLNGASISYEQLMKDQEGSIRTLREYAEAQAKQEMRQAKLQEYVELIKQQAIEQEKLAEATKEAALAQEWETQAKQAYDNSYETHGTVNPVETHGKAEAAEYRAAQNAAKAASDAEKDLQDKLTATTDRIAELEAEWGKLAETGEKVTRTFKDDLGDAFAGVQEDLATLCQAYDDAYASARSSIDGQIGLFETMKTETTMKVSEMQTALSSQLEYLTLYTENLHKAAKYGLDEGLIASLSDGSAESAGYIDAIIKEYERLGGEGSEAADAFVKDFNKSFTDVQQAKDSFADTVAKMETDFDEEIGKIEKRLEESIAEMRQEDDAAAAAKATIDAYVKAIEDGADDAEAAAKGVAAGVTAAFNSTLIGPYSSGGAAYYPPALPAYAGGTDFAEDVFIAGENGPELIVGARGAKVYTADETDAILRAARPEDSYGSITSVTGFLPEFVALLDKAGSREFATERSYPTEDCENGSNGTDRPQSGAKRIVLEIAGAGSISVDARTDKNAVLEIIQENLKPVLTEILSEEIFEEGDGSYEY